MSRRSRGRSFGALAALGAGALCTGALASGCGSSSGSNGGGSPARVSAVDLRFEPATTTVKVGQTVTWTNKGKVTHNVSGRGFFSRALDPGKSYSFTPRRSGRFPYLCTLHPQTMRATLVVER